METNTDPDLEIMREFDSYVKEFTYSANAGVTELDCSLEELFDISESELLKLNSEECIAKSFKISGYAMYIRSQLNENLARLNWCEDSLNRIIAKQYNDFDPYMKYEVRRQAIIDGDSFAYKVEKLRSRLKARVVILEDKLKDIRDMAETIKELGRRKGFNERS